LYDDPAVAELLADEALFGLDQQDRARLNSALAGRSEDGTTLAQVCAMANLAMLSAEDVVPLPASVAERLMAAGEAFCRERRAAQAATAPRTLPFQQASPRRSILPWAIAASAMIAAIGMWSRGAAPKVESVAALSTAPDRFRLVWSDWDTPEVAGVSGEVVWSEAKQVGEMTFRNLPKLDAAKEQYQLWIVDTRGMGQRISGGLFNGGEGDVKVAVRPALRVQGAQAFAITIEPAGGVWVSDMSRRVVIAAKTKS
jgi:anti-sigma-K factor RskA